MTANQINYWKMQKENIRGMVANAETERHNKAIEAIQKSEIVIKNAAIQEEHRHNLEQELLGALQQKANLAQAAASQTAAAAAYKQATVRQYEYEQQKWVDTQTQSRLDLLAKAEYQQRQSQAALLDVQAITEARRADLITAQTANEQALTVLNTRKSELTTAQTLGQYVSTARNAVGIASDVVDIGKNVFSIAALIK